MATGRRTFSRPHLEADTKYLHGVSVLLMLLVAQASCFWHTMSSSYTEVAAQGGSGVESLAARANLVPSGGGIKSDRSEECCGQGSFESRETFDQVSWPSQGTDSRNVVDYYPTLVRHNEGKK